MARAMEQVSGRSSSYIGTYRSSAAEREDLAGDADRVVVGDQEAGAGQDAQLGVGQEVERLLGDGQRVRGVGVGPQKQDGEVHRRVGVLEVAVRVAGPAAGGLRPRADAVAVA